MLQLLQKRLEELRAQDCYYQVFGANKHHYRSTRVAEMDVRWFEQELGTPLPHEFRRFLLEVGYGAGPYYGIWSPRESLTEIHSLCQEIEAEEGIRVSTTAAFPLTAEDLRNIKEKLGRQDKAPWVERNWPSSGCVPICDQGCTFWSVLVLQGEFVGRVWDVACFVGYQGEWLPARRPPGWWEFGMPHPKSLPQLSSPPTFVEWFDGWVERCLTDLRENPLCPPRET